MLWRYVETDEDREHPRGDDDLVVSLDELRRRALRHMRERAKARIRHEIHAVRDHARGKNS